MSGRLALVAVGHGAHGTGFGRVLWALLPRLADAYDVHLVSLGHDGATFVRDGVTVHPGNPRGGDPYGAFGAAALLRGLGGGICWLLNDLWMLKNYPPALAPLGRRVRTVAYVPLDGRVVDDALVAPVVGFDRLVAYTAFGRAELQGACDRLRAAGHAVRCGAVRAVPHGVDVATFAPRHRPAARRVAFSDAPHWHGEDAFVVLNANRAQPRKRLDLTLEAFARFARGTPRGVGLCLHAAVPGEVSHDALRARAEALGIADRVRLSPPGALGDAALATLYAACDAGVNTALGEGWGLVAFEHAATGAPQIVPAHSACGELWAGAAALVPSAPCPPLPFTPLAMAEPSVEGVAAALARLYADRAHRDAMGRAARERALDPALAWDAIAARWRALLAPLARAVAPSRAMAVAS